MKEYINEAEVASKKDDLLTAYDQELKTKEWGHQEGYEEGRQEGRQEGIEETRIEMVENMLKDELPIEKIALYSKLSEEEIKDISNK